MRHRTIKLITPLLLLMLLGVGISQTLAEAAQQPGQPTNPQGQDDEATATAEPNISIVEPAPTSELDTSSLVFPDGWQNPINLSRSGSTSQPQFVQDGSGTIHVLWLDELAGFGYSFGRETEWSAPQSPEFPFYTRRYYPDLRETDETPRFRPALVAGPAGQVFALWIDSTKNLYVSSASPADLAAYDAWTPRALLASGVSSLDVAAGADGAINLAYIRSSDSESRPSGVYYQRLDPGGTWGEPVLLYASRYLRGVSEETANVDILSAGTDIYVAWDDTLRDQVYFTVGRDNGSNWAPAMKIDQRQRSDSESSIGPEKITIGSIGESVHLTWAAGHEADEDCTQYIAVSTDRAATWADPASIDVLPRCFTRSQLFRSDDILFLVGTTEQVDDSDVVNPRATYILAWNGSQWSEPQLQDSLTAFVNPETNQFVRLGCQQGLARENTIQIFGCDTEAGSDVWILSRQYDDITDWFPPPPVWQGPLALSISDSDPFEAKLVASNDGIVHAFWNEEDSGRIFHAEWNGQNWSSGQAIIASPEGSVADFSVATANNRLYAAWTDTSGGLYFSEASLSNTGEWSTPAPMALEQQAASTPSLVADDGGNVFLAYVQQLNEDRGVYLLHSADAAATWSNPIQVFDAAAAGWDMVDYPRLTITENGQMHLLWARRSLPPESVTVALGYSRSEDLGQSWSPGETVIEAQASWFDLVGAGERLVHRLWSDEQSGQRGIWHSYSTDGGLTWNPSEQVVRAEVGSGIAAAVDPVTRLQLLQLENGQLSNLVWDNEQWSEEASLAVDFSEPVQLAVASNQNGDLVVSYVDRESSGDESENNQLYGMRRTLDLPSMPPTPLPTLTPTAIGLAATATATPEPTATIFFPTEPEQSGVREIPGLGGLPISVDVILSLLPVLIIVAIGVVVGVRIIRKR